jgi:hypothetical protein
LVQLSKPEAATFTRVLGFQVFPVFARATAMFGAALQAGAVPLALNDDCFAAAGYYNPVGSQPANGSGAPGYPCNFGSVVPPACGPLPPTPTPTPPDLACYRNAVRYGMTPSVFLGPTYWANSYDLAALSSETAADLQWRIDQRPSETCTTFASPSPRVVWLPVVPGGFGGSTFTFVRYRAYFLISAIVPTGIQGCFVKATINGGDFDPNAVGTSYGGVLIMKLVRSTGTITPVTMNVVSITNPALRGVAGTQLKVHTNQPGATCTPTAYYMPPAPGQPSRNNGLGPQITDASGDTTWTWTVENTPTPALLGLAQIQIQCTYRALLGYAYTTTTIA